MTQKSEDVKFQVDQIKGVRRPFAHSTAGSRMALRRVPIGRPQGGDGWESWPRPTMSRSRRSSRNVGILLLAIFVLFAVALLTMTIQRQEAPLAGERTDVGTESARSTQAPASAAGPAVTKDPFVILIRALRACKVRVMVDGIALEWRPLQEGDEILARPHQEMLVESNAVGALSATVNGKEIFLEPPGRATAFRLTSASLFTRPVWES